MPIISPNNLRFVYFGTPEFAVIVLGELEAKGYLPSLIVTAPDKPKGRKLILTPSEVKVWGEQHDIRVITPTTLKNEEIFAELKKEEVDLFVVAAYGKIIPKNILDIPQYKTLNVHPSLLPRFRGASPIESAILSDESVTGVTIMEVDEETDHGPVIAQRERVINNWPPKGSELTVNLAHFGGKLLAEIIPEWLNGLQSFPQDHTRATFTQKITKEDGLIELSGDARLNYKKIRAFDAWPIAYFFTKRGGKEIRVKIHDAHLKGENLVITKVTPEGKKGMSYEDFLRGGQD